MADKTGINWCDSTFNPWIGCTKVSPACDHCYAEREWQDRRHVVSWGPGAPRKRTSAANWKNPVRWNAKPFYECEACGWRGEDDTQSDRLRICMHCGTGTRLTPARRRVFCASLADVFDNEVDPQWRVALLRMIADTPNLDWLLLTKRIGNAQRMMVDAFQAGWPNHESMWERWPELFRNVWLGASVCNQAEADRDIPKLLAVPAAVRFLSMEPLLGHVDVFSTMTGELLHTSGDDYAPGWLDWVIVGGESGPKARPMHPDWPRQLRDQCAAAGVPFLFKQWGEYAPALSGMYYHPLSGMPQFGIQAGSNRTHDFGDGYGAVRIGTKAAGRLLDGIEHNSFPMQQPAADQKGGE